MWTELEQVDYFIFSGYNADMFGRWFENLKTAVSKPSDYLTLANKSFWTGYWYLYWLIFIGVLVYTLIFSVGTLAFIPELKKQLPAVKQQVKNAYPAELVVDIRNGAATTNVEEPYAITLKKVAPQLAKGEDFNLAVIDTTAAVEDFPKYNTAVLLTKNSLVYPSRNNSNTNSYEVMPLTNIAEPVTLDRPVYDSLVNPLMPVIDKVPMVLYYFAIVGIFLFPLVGSFFVLSSNLFYLLLATLGLLVVAAVLKKPFTYKTMYKASMFGLTIPLVGTFITGLLGIDIPWLYHGLFFGWMICVLTLSPSRVYTQSNARQKKVSSR